MGKPQQPLTITIPVEGIYDLDVLCWGLESLGFEVDNRAEEKSSTPEPSKDSPALWSIAEKTTRAVELASAALEELLELDDSHPARSSLASAASAAAAAAVRLLGGGQEGSPENQSSHGNEHKHSHHHDAGEDDPCGCDDCQASYKAQEMFNEPGVAAGVRCGAGRLRVMDGHHEILCSWFQPEDTSEQWLEFD